MQLSVSQVLVANLTQFDLEGGVNLSRSMRNFGISIHCH